MKNIPIILAALNSETPHLRLARPVSDLARTEAMYRTGLDLAKLGAFVDHQGFDGVMLGHPGGGFHFEFTRCRQHPVSPTPTPEDLMVLYVPERAAWEARCTALLAAGFTEVAPLNPYWKIAGRTYRDLDGYLLVIQCAAWSNRAES